MSTMFDVPRWLLIVLGALAIRGVFVVVRFALASFAEPEDDEPYIEFERGTLDGLPPMEPGEISYLDPGEELAPQPPNSNEART